VVSLILIDTNILIYAFINLFPNHRRAQDWLNQVLDGTDRVGLPWASLLGFLRVATNPRVFSKAPPVADAWAQVVAWLQSDTAWVPEPTERHSSVLGELLALPGIHGNLIPDAHLAALAIEHGLTLCSTDGDFARFPGLRWINPLQG
jgi:toxin-antitoxin system PIN domain toxin